MTVDQRILPPGTKTHSAIKAGHDGSALLNELMHTREFTEALHSFLPDFLRAWAGSSSVRKYAAVAIQSVVLSGFPKTPKNDVAKSLADVLRQPEQASAVLGQMPAAANMILNSLTTTLKGAESLPADEKNRLLENIFKGVDFGKIGELLTLCARIINAAPQSPPASPVEWMRPAVAEVIRRTDFGEIKESADRLSENSAAFTAMLNEELWKYPAKMLSLMSILPTAANAGMQAAIETLRPMNGLPPDLVTDVVCVLLRECKAADAARLVNEGMELFRKLHTGSVLIGDNGKPRLPEDIAALLKDFLHHLDIRLLLKTRMLFEDLDESTRTAAANAIDADPDLVRDFINSRFRKRAAATRRFSRALDAVERTLSEEQTHAEIARGVGELDAQEIAGLLNRLLSLFNRFHESSPDVLAGALTQTITSLDPDELSRAAVSIVDDAVAALSPVSGDVLPALVKGLAELTASASHDDRMKEAWAQLKNSFALLEGGR